MKNTTKINEMMLKAMAMLQAGRKVRGDFERKKTAIVLAKTYIEKAEIMLNSDTTDKTERRNEAT